jgi:hypothetical protein
VLLLWRVFNDTCYFTPKKVTTLSRINVYEEHSEFFCCILLLLILITHIDCHCVFFTKFTHNSMLTIAIFSNKTVSCSFIFFFNYNHTTLRSVFRKIFTDTCSFTQKMKCSCLESMSTSNALKKLCYDCSYCLRTVSIQK